MYSYRLNLHPYASAFNCRTIRTASTACRTSCTRRISAPCNKANVFNTVVPFKLSSGVASSNL